MIKSVRYCDRCGKEHDGYGSAFNEVFVFRNTKILNTEYYIKTNKLTSSPALDLCADCQKELEDWMNHPNENEENPDVNE